MWLPSHRYRQASMDTQTHRQTVLRHAYDHKLVPLWKILPPIWVTIHGLMPSASNPWPAGQGYMAVHQSSHNSACFIAPSVRHCCCTSPPRRRRSAKDAQYERGPISHCRAKKALNCEQQTSWPAAQAGNSLIWTFYKTLGTSCTISMKHLFPLRPLWVPTKSSIWTQASHC